VDSFSIPAASTKKYWSAIVSERYAERNKKEMNRENDGSAFNNDV